MCVSRASVKCPTTTTTPNTERERERGGVGGGGQPINRVSRKEHVFVCCSRSARAWLPLQYAAPSPRQHRSAPVHTHARQGVPFKSQSFDGGEAMAIPRLPIRARFCQAKVASSVVYCACIYQMLVLSSWQTATQRSMPSRNSDIGRPYRIHSRQYDCACRRAHGRWCVHPGEHDAILLERVQGRRPKLRWVFFALKSKIVSNEEVHVGPPTGPFLCRCRRTACCRRRRELAPTRYGTGLRNKLGADFGPEKGYPHIQPGTQGHHLAAYGLVWDGWGWDDMIGLAGGNCREHR